MPDVIKKLAHEILKDPVTVQVSRMEPTASVTQALYPVKQNLKSLLLLELLKKTDTEGVLIFARTKHRVKSVAEFLAKSGYKVTSLQGNLSQGQRRQAMVGFKDGTYKIMVATDIAARGIDISSISHVINFDIPDTTEAYSHRIGRTGRAAKTGDAFTLVTNEDEFMVRAIEKITGKKIDRHIVEGFDYAATGGDKESSGRSSYRPQGGSGGGRSYPPRNGDSRSAGGGGRSSGPNRSFGDNRPASSGPRPPSANRSYSDRPSSNGPRPPSANRSYSDRTTSTSPRPPSPTRSFSDRPATSEKRPPSSSRRPNAGYDRPKSTSLPSSSGSS
jgi:superfamily II DNA/RNA helicase